MVKSLFNKKGNIKYHKILILALLGSGFFLSLVSLSNLITIPEFIAMPIIISLEVAIACVIVKNGIRSICVVIENLIIDIITKFSQFRKNKPYIFSFKLDYIKKYFLFFTNTISILRC